MGTIFFWNFEQNVQYANTNKSVFFELYGQTFRSIFEAFVYYGNCTYELIFKYMPTREKRYLKPHSNSEKTEPCENR